MGFVLFCFATRKGPPKKMRDFLVFPRLEGRLAWTGRGRTRMTEPGLEVPGWKEGARPRRWKCPSGWPGLGSARMESVDPPPPLVKVPGWKEGSARARRWKWLAGSWKCPDERKAQTPVGGSTRMSGWLAGRPSPASARMESGRDRPREEARAGTRRAGGSHRPLRSLPSSSPPSARAVPLARATVEFSVSMV